MKISCITGKYGKSLYDFWQFSLFQSLRNSTHVENFDLTTEFQYVDI